MNKIIDKSLIYPPPFLLGALNSFLLKINPVHEISLKLKKQVGPTESSIHYEAISGVGFKADYVVHTPGYYFIMIAIDGKDLFPILLPVTGT